MSIFISYRRQDNADATGRIYDQLVARYGAKAVFKDVDSIPGGADFRQIIEKALERCDVFLAIIGSNWLTERLFEEGDYLRTEIETAFRRGITVIPVLLQGATLPGSQQLPPSLQELVYRHALTARADPDFRSDMTRLMKNVDTILAERRRQRHKLHDFPAVLGKALVTGLLSVCGCTLLGLLGGAVLGAIFTLLLMLVNFVNDKPQPAVAGAFGKTAAEIIPMAVFFGAFIGMLMTIERPGRVLREATLDFRTKLTMGLGLGAFLGLIAAVLNALSATLIRMTDLTDVPKDLAGFNTYFGLMLVGFGVVFCTWGALLKKRS